MKEDFRNPKSEIRMTRKQLVRPFSACVIRASFVIRHSSFVIGVWSLVFLWSLEFAVCSFAADPPPDRLTTQIGTNRVSITVSGGERVIRANGLPDHAPGQFP